MAETIKILVVLKNSCFTKLKEVIKPPSLIRYKMKHSPQQEDIYQVYENTNNNIFISATAGSGKTTTIVELAKRTSKLKKVIFLAFNKSIVNELVERLPKNIEVATLHSKGFSILKRNFKMNTKLNELKNFIYAKKILKLKNNKKQNAYLFTISSIINLMKLNLITGENKGEIQALCDAYGIITLGNEISDAIKVFNAIEKVNYNGKQKENIDFTDMLYLPLKKVKSEDFPKYDVVMLDECQDINPLQRELALNLLKKNGRLISVGDDKQTIYSFQGSSLDSFNYLKNRQKTSILPLSTTYRCGKNIVKEAKKYFDDIESYEDNPDGEVRNGDLEEAKDGDFVLCRNNLPLIKAFIFFLKKGKKSTIKGKDFAKGLLSLLTKIESIFDLPNLTQDKVDQLKKRGISKPERHPSYIDLLEKCDIIMILYKAFGDIDYIKEHLDDLFSDKINDGIVLSTIHKAKGLEADRVFFLDSELIPSKYATTELEMYAEKCLSFVAITRAKKELIYCQTKN